ncbi:MAG: metalloregulator ArsR/SmtB family transcription factor [Actinobacteria bacterium]|nr:metalloregulator ArsR/SmtB family transcription factor [Actinomycetota bacterium]
MRSTIHQKDVCDVACIHPEAVEQARKRALDSLAAADLSRIFQVMSDPTRLRIISILADGELCVCDIASALSMTVSAVSHQLRTMRMAQLVKYRKEGRIAFYSLDDDHVLKLFTQGLDHLSHSQAPRTTINKRKR